MSEYALLVSVGLVGGTAMACLDARRRGLDLLRVMDAILVAALVGLIAARTVYVAVNWAYYSVYPQRAWRLWDGGLAWHGALGGGLAAVLVYCAIRRTSFGSMLDVLTPGAAVLAACAWLGCLRANCAWGMETYPGQGILWTLSLELPDLYGIRAPRVAVQLLGAGWSALAFATVLAWGRRARFAGFLFPLWLFLYCSGAFGLGFLRADETPTIAGWRADQVVDLGLAVIGAMVLLVGVLRRERSKKDGA